MRFDLRGRSGHRRLGLAVALSVLVHAALVTVAVTTAGRPPRVLPPAEKAMQWVEVVPVAPAQAPVRPVAPMPLRVAAPRAAPAERTAPAAAALAPAAAQAPLAATDSEPRLAAEHDTAFLHRAAAPPRPGASNPQPPSGTWDTEGIARALQRERNWQRRHGTPAAEALVPQREVPVSGVRLGEGVSVHESVGGDGSRVSRVQGPAGTHCVRVPSANRLPEIGAAPRLAPVTNCP